MLHIGLLLHLYQHSSLRVLTVALTCLQRNTKREEAPGREQWWAVQYVL